jgi:hypothetical protein
LYNREEKKVIWWCIPSVENRTIMIQCLTDFKMKYSYCICI